MVTSYAGDGCPMVQLCCPEQITIPQSFPNILKTYAKAAIRTQPYDILRWSAAYFRCLAYNATPPAKIRLERECRRGTLTKGYLKVLVTQVGKGFFISRCLLQEHWKALCLREDDLLKYLSLCRMLNWPQVHWLKLLAVMIGSLNETPQDTMGMVCELLTDDVDGGLARIPYWMFKICYTFVAQLECSQEQCFVNGQLVLPWGDLEEVTTMDRLPRVLSATLLKDTIIASCKAKFDKPHYRECNCAVDSSSTTESADFTTNSHLDDPKEFLSKCEDFDTIMLILLNAQPKPLSEDDFKEGHYIFERQLKNVKSEENVQGFLQKEAFQILREVGPPWTWLHQFTTNDSNTGSYNFIHQECIPSDPTPDVTPVKPIKETEIEIEEKYNLESLKSLIEEAIEQNKCDLEQTSSIISFLKSEELSERLEPPLDLNKIVRAVERAEVTEKIFTKVEELIEYVKVYLMENITPETKDMNDINMPTKDKESETIHKPEMKSESEAIDEKLLSSIKPEEDTGGQHISGEDHHDNNESLQEDELYLKKVSSGDVEFYCCKNESTMKPKSNEDPPQQYYCSLRPIPGIGAAVSQKTMDDFLTFLCGRSRSQRGLISPRNFKEERCPNMVDIKLD